MQIFERLAGVFVQEGRRVGEALKGSQREHRQIVKCRHKPRIGCMPVVLRGQRQVGRSAQSLGVQQPQVECCVGVASIGRLLVG